MKRKTAGRRSETSVPDNFTFVVHCGFSMQFTFPREDVACDPADTQMAEVTERGLERLATELRDYLAAHYAIDGVECEDDVLLGSSWEGLPHQMREGVEQKRSIGRAKKPCAADR